MIREHIEKLFPNLKDSGYLITSPQVVDYNCIAWAAEDSETWWWPDKQNTSYWPSNIPREDTTEAFVMAYNILGYEVCESSCCEDGFDKIVIYTKNGKPTHAARQLSSGHWTSKLGQEEDIEHNTLEALESPIYGSPTVFMKRRNI